jgi:hypothetical protein
VGHQGLKTPQWSAVRRDRSIARPVACSQEHAVDDIAPCGAPLPLMGAKTGSALLWGAKTRSRAFAREHIEREVGKLPRKIRARDRRSLAARGCLTIWSGKSAVMRTRSNIRHARPRAGHPRLTFLSRQPKTWMAGTSPAMTIERACPNRSRLLPPPGTQMPSGC